MFLGHTLKCMHSVCATCMGEVISKTDADGFRVPWASRCPECREDFNPRAVRRQLREAA